MQGRGDLEEGRLEPGGIRLLLGVPEEPLARSADDNRSGRANKGQQLPNVVAEVHNSEHLLLLPVRRPQRHVGSVTAAGQELWEVVPALRDHRPYPVRQRTHRHRQLHHWLRSHAEQGRRLFRVVFARGCRAL